VTGGMNDHGRLRAALPWVILVHVVAVVAALVWAIVADERGREAVVWRSPYALGLGAGALLVAVISFTLRRRLGATLAGMSRRKRPFDPASLLWR